MTDELLSDLEELAEQWEEKEETLFQIHERYDADNLGEVSQVGILKNELQDVIEGHKDNPPGE